MNKLIKLFYIVFGLLFCFLLINIPFREISTIYNIKSYIFVLLSIPLLAILIAYYNFVKKRKNNILFIIIPILLLISLSLFIVFNFDVPLGWDYEIVFGQAKCYVENLCKLRNAGVPGYFQYFPNNIPIFMALVGVNKIDNLLGFQQSLLSTKLANFFFLILTVIFTFLYVKNKFGIKKAAFSLLLFILYVPFYLYIPVFYSDTLSILFGPLLLYISLYFESDKKYKRIISYILFAIFSFIGCKMKMTIIFIPISIIVALLFKGINKKKLVFLLIFFSIFLSLGKIYNHYIFTKDIFSVKYNNYGSVPYTHWIMMGMENPSKKIEFRNSYGGYNGDDYTVTESFTNSKKAEEYNIKEIKRRLNKYGIVNYLTFLSKKAVNAWGDGSFYVTTKLGWKDKYNTKEYQKYMIGKDDNHILIYFCSAVQYVFIILLVYSFIYSLKNNTDELFTIQLAISFLFVFLLFWENRSRYLYNYIPLFIIVITYCIDKFSIKHKKINSSQ